MAILQALFALLTKSAGKILNAIFGWAVHALFGQTSSRQQTFLSALVGAAVAWPLLLVGLIAPKIAALMLAFVPLPHSVPGWIVRLVWLGLALTVPFALGWAISAHPGEGAPHESAFKRLLRGFPITVGLATAFIIMFVSVPIMRLVALVKRQKSADVPLATTAVAYHEVAEMTIDVLNQHDFKLRAAKPGWWVSAPTRILGWFGGESFRRFVPTRLEHYESPALVVSFYTSGVLLRGKAQSVTWAHGLIAETVPRTGGLQTMEPDAKRVEGEIRSVWKLVDENPDAHTGSRILLKRVEEIARELGKLDVAFEDWQTLYRQLLQLDRAVRGEPQLLELSRRKAEAGSEKEIIPMEFHGNSEEQDLDSNIDSAADPVLVAGRTRRPTPPPAPANAMKITTGRYRVSSAARPSQGELSALSTVDLVKEISGQVGLLAHKQMDLAKNELRADLLAEVGMVKGLSIAALAGLAALNLLLVTGVLALSQILPAWTAGLIVSGAVLAIALVAGMLGWGKRVRNPMERTRRTLTDDTRWAKERLA